MADTKSFLEWLSKPVVKNGGFRVMSEEKNSTVNFPKKKIAISVNDMVIVGVFAAIIFVVTYFIRIPIPTPVGETNFKLANALCLLAGLLFGGLRGGLAAGIGSMMFDLFNPKYIASAPTTFINFFLMAFICGLISFMASKNSNTTLRNIIASIAGALTYCFLYISKSIIGLMIAGEPFSLALSAVTPKIVTTLINAVIAVVVANILAPIFKSALKRAGFYKRFAT